MYRTRKLLFWWEGAVSFFLPKHRSIPDLALDSLCTTSLRCSFPKLKFWFWCYIGLKYCQEHSRLACHFHIHQFSGGPSTQQHHETEAQEFHAPFSACDSRCGILGLPWTLLRQPKATALIPGPNLIPTAELQRQDSGKKCEWLAGHCFEDLGVVSRSLPGTMDRSILLLRCQKCRW